MGIASVVSEIPMIKFSFDSLEKTVLTHHLMLVDSDRPRELVYAAFIRDDEHAKKVGKLQEIIYHLDEKNFCESVDKIIGIGFTSDILIGDLARNIIHLSCVYRYKISLFVRLVSELRQKCDIVTQIERLLSYGLQIEAYPLIRSLIEANIIDGSSILGVMEKKIERENEIEKWRKEEEIKERRRLQKIIEEDNIKELEDTFSSPNFDINKRYYFKVQWIIYSHKNLDLTLVEFAALCGSIACFRFLYINGAKIDQKRNVQFKECSGLYSEVNIIHYAITGGNVDIMTILEQLKIIPDPTCIAIAIRSHRIEIYDWLVEQFPRLEPGYSYECLEHEFVHGILRIGRIDPHVAFNKSCSGGLSYICRLLVSNFSIRADLGLIRACKECSLEVVKFLLTIPSINLNKKDVSKLFAEFLLLSYRKPII